MWTMIKKYWLAEVVLAVAIVGLVVIWITGPKNNNQNQDVLPAPSEVQASPTPPPAAAQGYGPFAPGDATDQITQHVLQEQQNKNDYPLAGLLPHKTDLFTIDHYRDVRLLVVIVKNEADEKAATDGVDKWLVQNGFAADSHKIVWQIGN